LWYRDLFTGRWGEFWLEEYFSDEYREYTEEEVAFLRGNLREGLTLDLCCGPGRDSIPLSSRLEVVCFDLSRYFLSALRERARNKCHYKSLDLIEGDMRGLPFRSESFDNVINLNTSFGYFSDEENEVVIHEVSRVLKPDGIFILDVVNPGWIMRNFQERCWDESDSFYVLERRRLDWRRKRMESRWTLIDKSKGKEGEVMVDYRLYDLNELKDMLAKAGLKTIDVFSSVKKEKFHEMMSRRIIIVSKKS